MAKEAKCKPCLKAQEKSKQDSVKLVSLRLLLAALQSWGEPRLTHDADIRVFFERDQASDLLKLLEPDYICLSSDPEKTLQRMGFLFVKDQHGRRIDLMLSDTIFDIEVIQRARSVEVSKGLQLVICSPEDLIVYKMISTRARDREDVEGIVHRQGASLDDTYVLDWLRQFEQALDDSTLVKSYRRMRGLK